MTSKVEPRTITIRIPLELHKKAKVKLALEHKSFQELLENSVREYVGETNHDQEYEAQMAAARECMEKYREALSELAK
jgi:hypothetical protein